MRSLVAKSTPNGLPKTTLTEPQLRLTVILLPSQLVTPHGLTLLKRNPLPLTAKKTTNGLPLKHPTHLPSRISLILSLRDPPSFQARMSPYHRETPAFQPCHLMTPGPRLSWDQLSRHGLHPVSTTEPPPILMAQSSPLTLYHHHGPHLAPILLPCLIWLLITQPTRYGRISPDL